MFKRVLVTGGAGFIGSHTVDALLARGYKVRVLDNLEPQVHGAISTAPAYLSPEAEFMRGDILNEADLLRALDGCDAVIHDAAMVGVGQSQYQIRRYTEVNTLGTALLLDFIVNKRAKVDRFLVASSMSIYGEGQYRRPSDGALSFPILRSDAQMAARDFEPRDPDTGEALRSEPTPETKPLHCTSIYALNKKDQEQYTLLAATAHGLSAVACRYFNVYGPRQSLSNPYTGVAAIFSSRIKNGNRPLIYEDGKQSRDFIHVRDIAAAKVFLLENPKANRQSFNLCTGRATSVEDVALVLAKLLGAPHLTPEIPLSYRTGDTRHCFGDPSRLAALGWRASISFEDGMKDLVQWSAQQASVDLVGKAHAELLARGLVKA